MVTGLFLGGSNISECKENYKKVSSMVDKMNSHIEEFYFEQLSSEERARFANPLLFNYIGSTKIQYARLLPLDLNTFKEKDKTRNRFYTLIFSFFILILYFILKIKKIRLPLIVLFILYFAPRKKINKAGKKIHFCLVAIPKFEVT